MVSSFRLSFNSTISSARTAASVSDSHSSSFKESRAVSNLPLAFRQGPIRNPISWDLIAPIVNLFCKISAFIPIFVVRFSISSPSFTRIRFSPCSSITSATVAIPAYSSNSSLASAGTCCASYSAQISLNATPAPHNPRNGYVSSSRFGSNIASAFGICSCTS